MATDHSPVRFALIVKVGGFAIVTLLAVRVALGSYFDHFTQVEEHRKVGEAKPDALISLRADEAQRLNGGAMSIESAMHELAKRGRMAMNPEIAPTASRDVAPLKGWVKMPSDVPPLMAAEPPGADAGADTPAAATGDAGPAKAADAGVPHKKLP